MRHPSKSPNHALAGKHLQLQPLSPAIFFVLLALSEGEKHGYAIMQQTVVLSDGKFRMGPGVLYTTIQRLVELQLIEENVAAGEADSRRRFYRLSGAGAALLQAELRRMRDVLEVAEKMKFAWGGRSPS